MYNTAILQVLLDQRRGGGQKSRLPNEIITVAMENSYEDMMELLLKQRGVEIEITEGVMIAAIN